MRLNRTLILGVCLAAHAGAADAPKCELVRQAVLPIVMDGAQPTLATKINGMDAEFILDSGAFYSMLPPGMASALSLKTRTATPLGGEYVGGVGGTSVMQLTTVKEFEFAGVHAKNVDFLVGGSALGGRGLLGNNLMGSFDVEYDLVNGRVALYKVNGCGNADLAFWKSAGQQSSIMLFANSYNPPATGTLIAATPVTADVTAVVYVNGVPVDAVLDTGAFSTVVRYVTAEKAGVKISPVGANESDYVVGIGSGSSKSYIGSFNSITLGSHEEIKNTRARVVDALPSDMLLGADFFLSHHVFISRSQHKVFFTYNGGPVFNLAGSIAAGAAPLPELKDADALVRRGMGLAARDQYEAALADLNKAIELDGSKPEYFFERGKVYAAMGDDKRQQAVSDLDQALKLRSDFMPAMMPRASLRYRLGDTAGAIADLDNFDRLASPHADERMSLAEQYENVGRYAAAVHQFSVWIDSNSKDSKLATALAGRCRARALGDSDLKAALDDCDHALSIADSHLKGYRQLYAARGLVRLRLKQYDKAIADFNDALKNDGKDATALYARGVARLAKNDAGGQMDIDAARQLSAWDVDHLKSAGFGN